MKITCRPLPLFLTALLLITSVPEIVNAQSLTTNGFGKGGKPKPTPTPSPVPTDPYWDVNGSTAGSGGTAPSGNWDLVTANWNNTADGTGAVSVWVNGSDAVFSAGTDATSL